MRLCLLLFVNQPSRVSLQNRFHLGDFRLVRPPIQILRTAAQAQIAQHVRLLLPFGDEIRH